MDLGTAVYGVGGTLVVVGKLGGAGSKLGELSQLLLLFFSPSVVVFFQFIQFVTYLNLGSLDKISRQLLGCFPHHILQLLIQLMLDLSHLFHSDLIYLRSQLFLIFKVFLLVRLEFLFLAAAVLAQLLHVLDDCL